jgi:hypothetical protein
MMHTNNNHEVSIEFMLQKYIDACCQLNFDLFAELLYDSRVDVNYPSKKNYEKFIRSLIRDLRNEGYKRLDLKIEEPITFTETHTQAYNFYHFKYTHPRLSTKITRSEDSIILDVLPF